MTKKFENKNGSDFSLAYGKLPPQAREVEEAVIGAVMIEEKAIHLVVQKLPSPDFFYLNKHQLIWKAILELYHMNENIDALTVVERLKKNNELETVGGAYGVAQITNSVGSAGHIESHAMIIVEKHIARMVIATCTDYIKQAYEPDTDPFELTAGLAKAVSDISAVVSGQAEKDFSQTLHAEIEALRKIADTPEHVRGVPTGSQQLDKHTFGWQPGNLIINAGRPSMGKTALAWWMAIEQVKKGIPIGFFSLEMTDRELVRNLLSAELSIHRTHLKHANLSPLQWDIIDRNVVHIQEYPLHLDDTAGLTINQICAIARNWKLKHNIQMLYIDYLQKIEVGDGKRRFGTRTEEVNHVSNELKKLARTLNIPVMALAQLSRKVEERPDKRPELSDLKESGNIEQDADIVIFPWRPEYYGFTTNEENWFYPVGLCEVEFAKFRDGKKDEVARLIFEAQYSRFRDYTDNPFE